MFSIVFTMLAGMLIGHFLRDGKRLEKIEKSTSVTIFVLLFVLGLSVGSNSVITSNLGRFGWQAAVLAILGMSGSVIAAVYLRSFGGLSFREIGEVLGKTETWARVTYYRCKERLKTGGEKDEK